MMTSSETRKQNHEGGEPAAWSAVFSIALCVASLIAVEFLPASLLTPIAHGMNVSEGMAGQTLTATAVAAIFASLFASAATRGLDRRFIVLAYSALLILSSLLQALSTSFTLMLVGRVLLGFALGGFWAMAPSITMRLVSPKDVAKALSIVFGGVSVALVISAPAGSFLGAIIGWRGVFFLAAGLGALCLLWQALVLPTLPPSEPLPVGAVFRVMKRPGVPTAMSGIFAVFAGQFAFFTYLRPFFESVSHLSVSGISLVLLLFGITNFVGTSLSPAFLKDNLKRTLAVAPLILALCAVVLVTSGHLRGVTALTIPIWGFVFGVVPVGWSTWVTRNLSDAAESAGGLQVAVIQVANTFGAALGGYLLDSAGAKSPFLASALLLAAAGVIALARGGIRVSVAETRPARFAANLWQRVSRRIETVSTVSRGKSNATCAMLQPCLNDSGDSN